MDYAAIEAQPEVVSSTHHCQWDPAEATVAMTMSLSPPPTADKVDRLYRQLVEIHTIVVAQLVECARWRRSTPAPSLVWASTGRQGADMMLFMIRTVPPPLTNFSP
jgi:hypothetical protein